MSQGIPSSAAIHGHLECQQSNLFPFAVSIRPFHPHPIDRYTMGRSTVVAACLLNQWALDWDGNLARIKLRITIAKSKSTMLRLGPELKVGQPLRCRPQPE
jgi:hypothetical protein